jgi:LPXTG-motif cell wall-anchored protein
VIPATGLSGLGSLLVVAGLVVGGAILTGIARKRERAS